MELCTVQAVSNLPNNQRFLTANIHALVRTRTSPFLKQTPVSRSGYGLRSRTKQNPSIQFELPNLYVLDSQLLVTGYCFHLSIKVDMSTGFLYYTNPLPRATTSEEASNGANQYVGDKRDGVVTLEDVSPVEKNVYSEGVPTEAPKEESPVDEQTYELLDNLNIKFDSEDTYSILIYASGALVALWLTSAVVGSIDSIPLFPKLMEVVGLGYTFWFTSRYLLFKKNRDELAAKIEELKQQVLGSNDN
ncbi:hypothetical protein JRO89_XS08G0244700 [Xanthoceras sorbifolium]|uniref:Cyanobacterial aminoacyl-tRNA synthetase CAAD domain-containing protein n=1 Tax=Xanthoceras sorbifolium TaxID=99658 RepID=A0ABQ8HRE3_9ROSI|nr:hypothetical protein JRO89_XS08G0244700 [Xanthoceras sorbifolium]